MRTSLKTALLSALIATSLGGFALAGSGDKGRCANDGEFSKHSEGKHGGAPKGDHERMGRKEHSVEDRLERMTKHLDLTDTQQTAIGKIMNDAEDNKTALFDKMKANREQWKALEKGDGFDEAKATEIASQQGDIKAEMMVAKLKIRNEVHAQLTAEQRTQLEERKPPRHKRTAE